MKLVDVIDEIKSLNSEATIWIESSKKHSANSVVQVADEKETGGKPDTVSESFEYFLEVFIVSELVDDLSHLQGEALVNRIIDYAVDDA